MFDSVRPHRRQPTRLPHPWDSQGENTAVVCHFLLPCMKMKSESEVAQSSPTLCNPMDCSLPGSSIYGIFQARVPEWGAIAFSGRDLYPFPICSFPLFLCIDHWRRLSYLSLPFFGTLHSNGNFFNFLLCFSLLFFSQLFVRPPQTTILPFCISFSWGWFWSPPLVQCYKPPSTVFQALCLSDLIPWIYLSLSLQNDKGFDLGHTLMT